MQLRSALLAATVLAMPFAASAQPVTGLYIGAGIGVNITQQENVKNLSAPVAFPLSAGVSTVGSLKGGTGFAGVVSVGWGFGNGLRAEIEGNYRNNDLDGFNNSAVVGGISGGSREQKFGAMVNVLYDFNGMSPWFVPYIGAGVGWLGISEKCHASNFSVEHQWFRHVRTGLSQRLRAGYDELVRLSGHSGCSFPAAFSRPGATAEYRFLGTTGNRSYSGTATATNTAGVTRTAGTNLSLGPTYNHAILVGLRYNFGVAPPPPPAPAAVPAPAPTRSYLVFFDWDKATLTDRARQIIKEAADNSTKVQYTRIEVNGYTDTSGTPKYNQGLSVRRAKAVQAELVKDGVPQNAITIQGFGDTHLLVPTGPGVREPQNRRVEIIIR